MPGGKEGGGEWSRDQQVYIYEDDLFIIRHYIYSLFAAYMVDVANFDAWYSSVVSYKMY